MVADATLKVLVRVRPTPEDQVKGDACLSLNEASRSVTIARDKKGTADFTFSQGVVLGAATDQDELFSHCDLVDDVVRGGTWWMYICIYICVCLCLFVCVLPLHLHVCVARVTLTHLLCTSHHHHPSQLLCHGIRTDQQWQNTHYVWPWLGRQRT